MTWSDVTRQPKPRVIRQFGGICALLLVGLGLVQVFARSRPVLGGFLIVAGVVCVILGWLTPGWFRWCYTAAMLIAFPIGFVVTQVILAILFFVLFLAIGLFLRLRGWDAMIRHRKPPGATYWQPKSTPDEARRYLRQY